MNVRLGNQVANQPHTPRSGPVSSPMLESVATRDENRDQVRTLRETAARLRLAAFRLIAPSSSEEERSAEAV